MKPSSSPSRASKGAVAYLRRGAGAYGSSENAQRRAIRDWAKRQGTGGLRWHVDGATSARIEDRPAILVALASLAATGAKVLCVAEPSVLDRAPTSRTVVEHLARHVGG